jgi:hypothetical protein
MAGLLVEPSTLKAAGSQAVAAAESAPQGMAQIGPCAYDAVSLGVAAQLSEQARVAHTYAAMAGHTARSFGALLDKNAGSYTEQESRSVSTLGDGMAPAIAIVPASLDSGAPPLAGTPPTLPAGETPTTPRDIARLIHGGPGPGPMQAAAQQLRSHADDLELAAEGLGSSTSTVRSGWTSGSADIATARITELQNWYRDHAVYVRGLAGELDTQADHFQHARAQIPTPQQIDQAERELKAAAEANARSNGRLSPAVSQAQANLGRVYQAATVGYGGYATAAAPIPHIPTPPPAPPAGPMQQQTAQQQAGGDGPPAEQRQHSPVTDPVKPVDGGTEVAEITGGPTWPAGDVESANLPRPPVPDPDPAVGPDPVVGPVADVLPAIVPEVVGSIVGGAGGALGGLAGAAPRMLDGLGSAGVPAALAGMGNPAGSVPGGEQGSGEPQTPETPGGLETPHMPELPSGGPGHPGDVGGGGGGTGGTEPSGVAGPLAPAVGMAAAPEAAPIAAPISAATPAAAMETEAGGPGMGGMMMPPFFPPGRGGQGLSEADHRLYRQRRLRVVAPPNSEPVLRRREGRKSARDEGEKKP